MAPAALPATAVFEFRTTGAATNGGIFDSAAAGTDYSQQDAAQLALTDCACTTGGSTLTSATGGFTEAMVGNWCYLSGTHFATGRYKIAAYTDTNTVTLCADPTDGSDASSGTCNVGGAIDCYTDALRALVVAGNKLYLKAGTYSIPGSIVEANGTQADHIWFIGYNTSRDDDPDGDNRPLLALAAYVMAFGKWNNVTNLRFTHSGSGYGQAIGIGAAYSVMRNCKIVCSSNNGCVGGGWGSAFIDCEASSQGYYGFSDAMNYLFCYAHGACSKGFRYATNVINCISEGCSSVAIECQASGIVLNCTVYDSNVGIGEHGTTNITIFNNLVDTINVGSSPVGIKHNGSVLSPCLDYNNYNGNTTDVVNCVKGPHDTAGDPDFKNAAGGDFSLDTATDCDDTGFGTRLGVG